jgi:hypothetical protein
LLLLALALPAQALPPEGARGAHCAPGPVADAPHWLLLAGWRVQPDWAWHWLTQLEAAVNETPGGLRCIVRGPQDARFREQADLDLDALAAELQQRLPPGEAPLQVVAHSSGSFVAHALLRRLPAALRARVHYLNLEGGLGEGATALEPEVAAQLGSLGAVLVRDGERGESANAGAMRAFAERHGATLIELDAAGSGCAAGARWCLHMLPITRRPHRAEGFDLARDYGQLGPQHPVQTDYWALKPRRRR